MIMSMTAPVILSIAFSRPRRVPFGSEFVRAMTVLQGWEWGRMAADEDVPR